MSDPSPFITQDDLAGLNGRELLRRADAVRRAGSFMFGIAAVLVASWLWQVVRVQMQIDDDFEDGFDPNLTSGFGEISWTERVDAFVGYLSVVGLAAMVAGLAIGIRLYADVTTVRGGGDITPFRIGDEIDGPEDGPIELDPG